MKVTLIETQLLSEYVIRTFAVEKVSSSRGKKILVVKGYHSAVKSVKKTTLIIEDINLHMHTYCWDWPRFFWSSYIHA